jgi:dihydrofolate reductase
MRKLIMKMSITVDGFVGGPNGENDWVFLSSTEDSRARAVEKSWEAGLIIMGRKSFEGMAHYWPTSTNPFAGPMNGIPKAVFTKNGFKGAGPIETTTPEQARAAATWTEARIFDGDMAEGIRRLKSEPGKPIYAIGGAGFMRSLIATGLIDEYQLNMHPVVLGGGLTIFDGLARPLDLKLVEAKAYSGGIVAHIYQPG